MGSLFITGIDLQKFLTYGGIGVGLLVVVGMFLIINKEQKKREPRKLILSISLISMTIGLLFAAYFGYLESKRQESSNHGIEEILGNIKVKKEIYTDSGMAEGICKCEEDELVIGGGAEMNIGGNNYILINSKPLYDNNNKLIGWEARDFVNEANASRDNKLTVYALCVKVK